jgi:hypothetical protein
MQYQPDWALDCAVGPCIPKKRFQWEDTGRVRVCPTSPYPYPTVVVLESVKTILAEFKLPLEVDVATPLTQQKVRELLAKSATAGTIDCYSFLRNLNQRRRENPDLLPAVIIPFDGREYRLFDCLCNNPDEPPEWGFTNEGGLILLRLVRAQPLASLVRHEMGHLLGIDRHHTGCVMEYECRQDRFCNECLKTIRRTCLVMPPKD